MKTLVLTVVALFSITGWCFQEDLVYQVSGEARLACDALSIKGFLDRSLGYDTNSLAGRSLYPSCSPNGDAYGDHIASLINTQYFQGRPIVRTADLCGKNLNQVIRVIQRRMSCGHYVSPTWVDEAIQRRSLGD